MLISILTVMSKIYKTLRTNCNRMIIKRVHTCIRKGMERRWKLVYVEQIAGNAAAMEQCVQDAMNVRERFFMRQRDRRVLFTTARCIAKAIKTAESAGLCPVTSG